MTVGWEEADSFGLFLFLPIKIKMKYAVLLLAGWFLAAQSCSSRQCPPGEKPLPATVFSQRLEQCPDGVLLDVRTPEEFNEGHLPKSRNLNWEGPDFEAEAKKLDPAKPIFVYCLRGGRSEDAAAKLRQMGFKTVYELEGGIEKWRDAHLSETKSGD